MKAVLWISFLLFAASMAGIYHFYNKNYLPRQKAIAEAEAQAQAANNMPPANPTPAKEPVDNNSESASPKAPEIKSPKTEENQPDINMNVPKARVVTTGSQTIKSSIYKKKKVEKPKTPEELAREKELAALRKLLREAQALGEKQGKSVIN